MIAVEVATRDGGPPPLSARAVTSLVRRALGGNGQGQVQVIFSDDAHLRDLKRKFFNQDVYTDVIAFRLNDDSEPLEGEIYISTERALENSRRYRQTHRRELMRLVAHGSLHLAGLADGTPSEQARMRLEEDHILAAVAPSSDP
ncbi:MAG: rRNA maturation RNase YbeY [Candidatus Neomarinimicrobiota bacterium]